MPSGFGLSNAEQQRPRPAGNSGFYCLLSLAVNASDCSQCLFVSFLHGLIPAYYAFESSSREVPAECNPFYTSYMYHYCQ
ncbi:hypothetical protein BDV18DRAFT_69033 [Aspergillus unguis]